MIKYEDYGKMDPDPRLEGYDLQKEHPDRAGSLGEYRARKAKENILVARAMTEEHQRLPEKVKQHLREIAASSLGKTFGLTGEKLENFARCAADKTADKEIVKEVAAILDVAKKSPAYSSKMMEEAIVDAITAVHEEFKSGLINEIENNPMNDVFSRFGFDKLTSIEISGIKLASDHFVDYVNPILKQIGDNTAWREEYYSRSKELLRDCDINNPDRLYDGLQDYLLKNNIAGCGKHESVYKNVEFIETRAIPDIMLDGVGADLKFMKKLRDAGVQFKLNDEDFMQKIVENEERNEERVNALNESMKELRNLSNDNVCSFVERT